MSNNTLTVSFMVHEFNVDSPGYMEYQNEKLRSSLLYELEKHVEDGVEYVLRFRREDIPSQGLMTPRLLRHSVDVHLASKLIKQNEELKRRVDALERQNALLLSNMLR